MLNNEDYDAGIARERQRLAEVLSQLYITKLAEDTDDLLARYKRFREKNPVDEWKLEREENLIKKAA